MLLLLLLLSCSCLLLPVLMSRVEPSSAKRSEVCEGLCATRARGCCRAACCTTGQQALPVPAAAPVRGGKERRAVDRDLTVRVRSSHHLISHYSVHKGTYSNIYCTVIFRAARQPARALAAAGAAAARAPAVQYCGLCCAAASSAGGVRRLLGCWRDTDGGHEGADW